MSPLRSYATEDNRDEMRISWLTGTGEQLPDTQPQTSRDHSVNFILILADLSIISIFYLLRTGNATTAKSD